MTTDEIKELASKQGIVSIKYVRVPGEFRYAITNGPIEHRQLVKDGEKAISAGFFSFAPKDKFFFTPNLPSASLNLGPHEQDEELLKTIFLT